MSKKFGKGDDYTPDWWSKGSSWGGFGSGSAGGYKSCYESHPPLKVGEFTIYGSSCSNPIVKDADVYVGFDSGMRAMKTLPWEHKVSFLYPITDMSVPHDVESFKKLLAYLHEQLVLGKKVHLGCIGGHGRTGLVLSALVNLITGEQDSTEYVRKNYCKKAVESSEQINWLHKHFEIKKVAPSKNYAATGKTGGKGAVVLYETPKQKSFPSFESGVSYARGVEVHPLRTAKESIWG